MTVVASTQQDLIVQLQNNIQFRIESIRARLQAKSAHPKLRR